MAELTPQDAVNYRTAEDGNQSCASCESFRSPDKCALVQPPVGAAGVCDLWTKLRDEASIMAQLFGGESGEASPETRGVAVG